MKRIGAIIAVVVLATVAMAQVRGVPASVTSQGGTRSFTPGPAASITSLGPRGYSSNHSSICSSPGPLIPQAMGCTDPQFNSIYYGRAPYPSNTPVNRRGRGRNARSYAPAYAYPVYVPVPVMAEGDDVEAAPTVIPADEEAPAPTIFENRAKTRPLAADDNDESRYGTHYLDQRETAATAPAAEQRPVPAFPAVVLVYKDGHEREVRNYAIVGQYVYDLGEFVAKKIPLAELNLKATLKANNDRGLDFTLPASVSQ